MKTPSMICLLLILVSVSPAQAQTPSSSPVVHVLMFWMDGCPHCHYVLDEVLPPLQAKYGDQLKIRLVELVGGDEVAALYQLAESRGISKERVGVPFLVIGEHTLIGSEQIPADLPGLIDTYLATGGVGWPEITSLEIAPSKSTPISPGISNAPISDGIVEAILFHTPGCQDCELVITQAITPVRERYGDRFQLEIIDIITAEDVEYLFRVASIYGLEQEQVELPMLILGDSILVNEQIITEVSALVEIYYESGGVGSPILPERSTKSNQTVDVEEIQIKKPNGFALAITIIVIILAVLIYSGVVFVRRLKGPTSPWVFRSDRIEWFFPLLALIGLAVATYLAYVEVQAVQAVCGPVGDCNAVQSSPYARLFGMLPVGVLGLVGYVLILAAWFIQRSRDGRAAAWVGMALFGMIYGGSLFSLYLTYLEPFVIRAVCAWCLSSAVIVTALLLISQPSWLKAIDQLKGKQHGA